MSSKEFSEWIAFDLMQPGEPFRSDIQTALICQTIANAHAGKGKKFKLDDFMLKFGSSKPKTPGELKKKMLGFMHAAGMKIKKKEN